MKQLTINPKEEGTTIKFGKLPIFTRSLTHWSDMDNVVQLKVEGRYYAIELRQRQPSPLEEVLEQIKNAKTYSYSVTTSEIPQDDEVAKECKADVEQAKEESEAAHHDAGKQIEKPAPSNDLTELGFTNLSSEAHTPAFKSHARTLATGRKAGTDYKGHAIARGNLSLAEWLKPQDYLIYKLFSFGNGQPVFDQSYSFDECKRVFIDAGYPEKTMKKRQKGLNASRVAAQAISQAVRVGALVKDQGDDGKPISIYSLSVTNGRSYVAGVYRTVSAGTYDWDPRKKRVHHRG